MEEYIVLYILASVDLIGSDWVVQKVPFVFTVIPSVKNIVFMLHRHPELRFV